MHIRLAPLVSALALGSAACSASTVPDSAEGADLAVDEDAILSAVATFRAAPDFVPVNQNTYETALGTGAAINLFVSADSFAAYASIDADSSGSGATVPEGTLIIREVLEGPGGKVKSLTLMYKGPAGYNPDLADFWFGVTDSDGVVVVENGLRKAGRLQECYGCHLARAEDGYLFGVPASNRAGVTPPEEPPPAEEPPAGEPPPPVCGDFRCNTDENCQTCDYDCGECPAPGDEGDEDDGDHGGGDDDDEDHDDGGHDDDDDHDGDHD